MTKRRAIQVFTAIGFCIAVAWAVFSPGFEPLMTVFLVACTFIAELAEERHNTSADADRALFKRFLDVLPSNGSIHFIDEHNMAGFSFPTSAVSQLSDFMHEWDNAELEFLDPELETQRKGLLKSIKEYLASLYTNTFPTDRSVDRSTVPPEWEIEQPQRFASVVEELHRLAGEVVERHQTFVRTGRKRLKM